MRTAIRTRALLLAAAAALGGAPPQARTLAAPAAPERAPLKLAVIVSIDGLSWEWLLHNRPWYEAGLRRLLDEGHAEANARYRHLNTETAPGHAALATGAPPRVTGVVSNRWWEERGGKMLPVSSAAQPVPEGTPGAVRGALQGPGNLRVPTLGDRLVEARPGARVVSLSGKDRSAAFLAGRHRGHVVYWWDAGRGGFVSSAAYDTHAGAGALGRGIVERFNARSGGSWLPRRFGLLWRRLEAPAPRRSAPLPTPVPELGRYQLPQQGIGFDHHLGADERGYFASIYYSPFIDELLAELALDFLSSEELGLGRGAAPDVLALSFSGNDTVSHAYGRESEETLDALRRLDRQLGRLLDALEMRLAKGAVVVALSADHGFPPIPEVHRRAGHPAGRLLYRDSSSTPYEYGPTFRELLNRALAGELCLEAGARPILEGEGWSLVYDRPALPFKTASGACGPAGREVARAELDAVLARVVQRVFADEIERVLPVSERASWPRDDPGVEFAENDYDAERSGDVFLLPRRNVLLHWDPARGAHHGSHHEYDTHVPLIFWGGPFRAGLSQAEATPYDLAPTLAALLDLKLPEATGTARAPGR